MATRVVISVGDEKKLSGRDDMNAQLQVVGICSKDNTMIEKIESRDDVAQMVARFEKSRVDADEADSAQGKRDAAAWVRETASYRDMRALEAVADDFWQNLELDLAPGFELADALMIELERRYGEETTREAMLAAMFPSKGLCNSKVYLSGFVAEAMALWDEVKGRVVA